MDKRQAEKPSEARLHPASTEDPGRSEGGQSLDSLETGKVAASGEKKLIDLDANEKLGRNSDAGPKETHPDHDEEGKLETKLASSKLLPESFKPTPYSVIIGRGKESKDVVGNRRLRVLVSQFIPQYASAINRPSKTRIVNGVVSMVQEACLAEGGGAFVKLGKDGRWYEVDESVAREKVGYTFREMLGDRYRSSSHSKVARKYQLRGEDPPQEQEGLGHFDSYQLPEAQPNYFPTHLSVLETLRQQQPPDTGPRHVQPQNVLPQHWHQQDSMAPSGSPPVVATQFQLSLLASATPPTLPLTGLQTSLSRHGEQWTPAAILPRQEYPNYEEEITEGSEKRPPTRQP